MLASFREYVRAVAKELWGLVIGVVAAVIGAIALSVTGVSLTLLEWFLIVLACLSPAQFLAYHRLRERALAQPAVPAVVVVPAPQPIPNVTTNVTNNYYLIQTAGPALAPGEPPQLEQAEPEPDDPNA
jgi:hypothetical protein